MPYVVAREFAGGEESFYFIQRARADRDTRRQRRCAPHLAQQAPLAGSVEAELRVSLPYSGTLSSVWNDSQATPCGSIVQYLSLFA
jgi:hypothetical protein